jgi:hypothetical protein
MKLPYGLDKMEAVNLFKWAQNPIHLFFLVKYIIRVLAHSFVLRLLPSYWWYPSQVYKTVRAVPHQTSIPVTHITKAQSTPPLGPSRLRLAFGYLYFTMDPEWKIRFDDGEQYVSLHRWNWLLHALTDEEELVTFEWGVYMMRSWLHTMGALPAGLASESYTLGERIANAFLFARLAGGTWHCLPGDVSQALLKMALTLCRQLEYHGDTLTGNHPFNNARALYLAGKCLDVPALEKVALAIIEERLKIIVNADGFMREGSSHYHLLFTRWLLELNFVAGEFKDIVMLDLLEVPVRISLERCLFFLVQSGCEEWELPLIGDVSPDCTPDWLIDLPYSALVEYKQLGIKPLSRELRGWARLWNLQTSRFLERGQKVSISSVESEKPFQSFPNSGWYRLDWKDWTAIWRAQACDSTVQASHAHQDFASFVLYHRGQEVLIDIGRPNYERDSVIGNYSITPLAHNSISLEGLGPMLTPRDRYLPPSYRNSCLSLGSKFEEDSAAIELTHNGWKRLSGRSVKHKRRFIFFEKKIEVNDFFDGDGRALICIAFQWPRIPGLPGDGLTIECDLQGAHILKNEIEYGRPDSIYGWRFPAYGERVASATQCIQIIANLPSSIKHTIIIQEYT